MFIVKNAINKVLPGLAKCQQKGITDMNDIFCNGADKTRTNWGVMTVKYYLMTKKKYTPTPTISVFFINQKEKKIPDAKKKKNPKHKNPKT